MVMELLVRGFLKGVGVSFNESGVKKPDAIYARVLNTVTGRVSLIKYPADQSMAQITSSIARVENLELLETFEK